MAGIYIHIPFCKQKCSYCDFFSTANLNLRDKVIQAIAKEISLRKDYLLHQDIKTIYFGGGTPSLLNEEEFSILFNELYASFDLSRVQEITIEANPDDLDQNYIQILRHFPFNRLSVGFQTSNDKTLKLFMRRNISEDTIYAIRNCREAGYENISLDLIYGWPDEQMDDLMKDLDVLLSLNPQHVSAYHLTYEEKTSLYNKVKRGLLSPVDENLSVAFYHTIVERLKAAGIIQYEISNFAIPGFESKHNSSYWQSIPYLGVGPSAHSFNLNSRCWNPNDINSYIKKIDDGEVGTITEILNSREKYNDFILTRLRTVQGINLHELKNVHGSILYNYCLSMASPHLQQGRIVLEKDYLRLTQNGVFLSDSIISDLLSID